MASSWSANHRSPIMDAQDGARAPDLAIEVRSASDSANYLRQKVRSWNEAGCHGVWIADPRRKTFEVYDHDALITLQAGDMYDGGALFPGLALNIGALFD